MKKQKITRLYLETLSFADLLELADSYKIDVPENLNRSFLIGDLLDAAEDEIKQEAADMTISIKNDGINESDETQSYNATEIDLILRNPAWAFVYWSIGEIDKLRLEQHGEYSLFLHVTSLAQENEKRSGDSYDVQISLEDKSAYIMCPAEKKFIYVELAASTVKNVSVLASSKIIEIPRSSRLADMQPGKEKDIASIMEFSGMRELLREHYKNHRQSFS